MNVDYPYICKHFNISTEHEMSYEYDDDLFDLLDPVMNDPRLPDHIRHSVLNQPYYKRDLLRRLIRSYAYALRYPNQIPEPIAVIKSALYFSIKTTMHNLPRTNWKITSVWRRAWSERLLEELYEEVVYYEKHSGKGNIQPLNYWGNGKAKTRYLPSREIM